MCLALACRVTSVWRFLKLVFFRAVYPGKYLLVQAGVILMYRVEEVQIQGSEGIFLHNGREITVKGTIV
jgi:hypothetical protein